MLIFYIMVIISFLDLLINIYIWKIHCIFLFKLPILKMFYFKETLLVLCLLHLSLK